MDCHASIATLSLDLSKLPSHLNKLDYVLPSKQLAPPTTLNSVGAALTSKIAEFNSLTRLLRKKAKGFDLVCACNFPSYWATYFAKTGKPLLWLSSEVLGPYSETKDIYNRSYFFRFALEIAKKIDKHIVNRFVDPIITCSELNSRLILNRYGREAVVVHTGVDYDYFDTKVPNAKARLGFGDSILLLHVGTLIEKKNHILSIRALKRLKQNFDCKLVIVGEGPWKPRLQKEAEKLDVQNDVIFTGSISENKLRSFYYACDVNLFPVKDQTWGLVPFEALVAGKPSIISNGCGAAEIMKQEKIALLIEPTVEDLEKAVTFALTNPDFIKAMVKRGKTFVLENLTWTKYAQDVYCIYRDVLYAKQK